MEIDVEVKGLDELEKRLLKFGAEMGEKTLNSALMSASLPMFKTAKSLAPGSIKDAITRRKIRNMKSRRLAVRGIKSTGRSAGGVALIVKKFHKGKAMNHAHLLEFGTDVRTVIGKGNTRSVTYGGRRRKISGSGKYAGANRGKGPRLLYMTKAWEMHKNSSLEIFKKTLTRKIKRLERMR